MKTTTSTKSDVPKPVSFSISAIKAKLDSAVTFGTTVDVASGTLALNNADGGTTGVSGTSAESYSLYWSHLWTKADFPPGSSTKTNVALQVTFDLVYPVVPATTAKRIATAAPIVRGGHRNFFEHRVIQRSTSSFAVTSPRFVVSSTSSVNRDLIIGLSVMGGVLVIGAAVVVIIVLRRRGRKLPSPEEPAAITVEEIKDFQ